MKSARKNLNLRSVVWKEGKYHVAQCLQVDVSSFGRTKQEALANLEEALTLYFDGERKPNVTKVERPILVESTVRYA